MADAYYYSSQAGAFSLTSSVTASGTVLLLSGTSGLPASLPFKMVLDPGTAKEEIVKVTNMAGSTLTVVRAWDGASSLAHDAGAVVRHMVTAEDIRLSRQHEAASAGVHGISGSVVGTSDSQSLLNKDLSSSSNTFPATLVTLTGSQALFNKDLSSGTNTFPSSLVTLAGNQTLTNKTLTSPVLNGAIISSPAITSPTTGGLPAKLTVVCTSTTRPTSPSDGDRIYETDTGASGNWNAALSQWVMFDSVWQSYTAQWVNTSGGTMALGTGGTLVGEYFRTGRKVDVFIFMQLGTAPNGGSSAGNWYWTLPFSADAVGGSTNAPLYGQPAFYVKSAVRAQSATVPANAAGVFLQVGGGNGVAGPTSPSAWAANDSFEIRLSYKF